MSARDDLAKALAGAQSFDLDLFQAAFDEHAHELAERIRLRGMAHLALGRAIWPFSEAADLIDPEVSNNGV
jgi:hypothetical protein